jgi:membrane protease subunit HflC
MRKATFIIPAIVVALVLVLSSIFIVDERERALVLQFGQIKRVKEDPGLAFKVPLIQEVVTYDDRILSLDTQPTEVTPSDDRRLVVDAFARYRIADVVQFRQAVGVGGLRVAEDRLEGILNAQVRAVLGSEGVTSNTILSSDRSELMTRITEETQRRAEPLGIDVLDVRLKQTALPEQNLAATFERMRAEREREATDERARGEEAAQRVRAQADRTVVELVSEASREAEITRGEADAERNAIFAEAFGADPEFFEFYRSLTAYQRSLQAGNSTLVMSPDSEFFDYLKSANPGVQVITDPARAEALLEQAPAIEVEPVEEAPTEPAAPADDTSEGAAAGGTATGGDAASADAGGAVAAPAEEAAPAEQ